MMHPPLADLLTRVKMGRDHQDPTPLSPEECAMLIDYLAELRIAVPDLEALDARFSDERLAVTDLEAT